MASLLAFGAAPLLTASTAEAVFVEADNPGILLGVTVGAMTGLTTSIAGIVYAVQGRTFDSGWIFPSLFGAAVTGAMTVSLIADGASRRFTTGHGMGVLLLVTLTAWPTYWTVRTAIADVDPGEYLNPELDPELEAEVSLQLPNDAVMVPVLSLSF